ncbi:MAG TPA: carboxypeptidase regulatory-like domain-containing protein [Longimicrobium sp.]|jgi:hypothetical protein
MPLTSRFAAGLAVALTAGLLASSAPLLAQAGGTASLDVVVVDSAGGPIAEVLVEVAGVRGGVRTNDLGVARVNGVPAGTRLVYAYRLGFGAARVPVQFAAGEAASTRIMLTTDAVTLAGVQVVVDPVVRSLQQAGFYARQRRGMGAFMTGDRIEELRPMRTVDIFRRMRGFKVAYDARGFMDLQTTRGTAGLGNCTTPVIFLDGVRIAARTSPREDVLSFINPESLAGVEAYAGGASIPAEYNLTGSACGVVLLWTRTQ